MVVVEADMVAIASKESSGFDYLLAGHLKPVKKCLELGKGFYSLMTTKGGFI